MTSKSPLSIICDAGPLIHLDELNATSLLNDFHQVIVPEQVWREVQVHRPGIWGKPYFNGQKIEVGISLESVLKPLA